MHKLLSDKDGDDRNSSIYIDEENKSSIQDINAESPEKNTEISERSESDFKNQMDKFKELKR